MTSDPISNDAAFMEAAISLARTSKCVSRQVGCVIVQDGGIIASGVNGTPPGYHVNCCDVFDRLDFNREEHHRWSLANELHAEANAIARIARSGASVSNATIYVTLEPCGSCASLIAATRLIKRVVYLKGYDKGSKESIDTLRKSGIIVEHFNATGENV